MSVASTAVSFVSYWSRIWGEGLRTRSLYFEQVLVPNAIVVLRDTFRVLVP